MPNQKSDTKINRLNYFKNLLYLSRPFTLLLPFIVSIFIMSSSITYNNIELNYNTIIIMIFSGLILMSINAGSNAINQASDWKSDKISKPYRPIPRGIIKIVDAHSYALIIFLAALLSAITINITFSLIVFSIIVFSLTYSLPPRIKKYLFLNQVWISIARGLLGILAAWSVFGNPFTKTPLIIGSIAMFFLIGGIATKDIIDMEADKSTGVKTLMNTYGIKKTSFICLPFLIIPFIFIPFFIKIGFLELYFWPLTFLIIPSLIIYFLMKQTAKNNFFENTPAWSFMYAEYIFFALGFSLCTIFSVFV